jgi:apolipoprotein N-acyltransferase
LLLRPSGELSIDYHKRMTLPLAEDIPLKGLFPWLTTIFGERYFVPGVAGTPVVIDRPRGRGGETSGAPITAATVICYEDLVPNLLQKMVRDTDASLLVGLLNGQWFGETVAVHQHALLASWRAVENGRFFVRSGTTGVSRVIDPHGRIVSELPPFREGTLLVPGVPLLTGKTVFTRFGMFPAQVISVFLLLLAGLCYLRGRPTESTR